MATATEFDFATWVRSELTHRGDTLAEVGSRAGNRPAPRISEILSGKDCKLSTAQAIAGAFDCVLLPIPADQVDACLRRFSRRSDA